jgi:hypothetical protein
MSVLIFTAFLFCNNLSIAQQEDILVQLFNEPAIIKLLSLDNLADRAPVRIVDKTKRFKRVDFMFKPAGVQGTLINVQSISDYRLDFNTGYFRDISILSFKRKQQELKIDFYLSPHLCYDTKKSRLHVEAFFMWQKNRFVLKKINILEWS